MNDLMIKDNCEIKTEIELINEIVRIQHLAIKNLILSYYVIGKKVIQFYRKLNGHSELQRIASALHISLRQAQLIVKFAGMYSEEDLKKIFNGKFPLSWTNISTNLYVQSSTFIELYEKSSSKAELQTRLNEIKKDRYLGDLRFKIPGIDYDEVEIPSDLKIIEGLSKSNHSLFKSYIYFLVQNQEVVYVGQTKSLVSRISDHLKNNEIIFQTYYFKEVSISELHRINEIENFYIKKMNPKYNIQCKEKNHDTSKESRQDSNWYNGSSSNENCTG